MNITEFILVCFIMEKYVKMTLLIFICNLHLVISRVRSVLSVKSVEQLFSVKSFHSLHTRV